MCHYSNKSQLHIDQASIRDKKRKNFCSRAAIFSTGIPQGAWKQCYPLPYHPFFLLFKVTLLWFMTACRKWNSAFWKLISYKWSRVSSLDRIQIRLQKGELTVIKPTEQLKDHVTFCSCSFCADDHCSHCWTQLVQLEWFDFSETGSSL